MLKISSPDLLSIKEKTINQQKIRISSKKVVMPIIRIKMMIQMMTIIMVGRDLMIMIIEIKIDKWKEKAVFN